MILLDTHTAIWYAGGIELAQPARRSIDVHLSRAATLLSAISAWEIGMLVAKGRLELPQSVQSYVFALFGRDGVIEEPVTAEIAELAARLPGAFHGDPADRIIVATAVQRSATLITRDTRMVAYAKQTRFVNVLAC